MLLHGARALVTGASSGIGREIARAFAARGARLAVAARRVPLLEELADEIAATGSPKPHVLETDLSERGRAASLGAAAVEALGGVDILVNNAGGGVGGSQWAVGDRDEAREAFEINLWSPLALTSELVPGMRERGSGAVVNVTSAAQIISWPGFGHYASTKAAFAVATETLRLELEGTRVQVLEVVVGPVETAVQAESRALPGIEKMIDMTPMGDPTLLSEEIVRGLEHGQKRIIYPRRVTVAYTFPRLARAYNERLVRAANKEIDAATREELMSVVVRTGSMGDLREVREEWERTHRD